MRLSIISARTTTGGFVVLAEPGNPRERSDQFKALVVAPPDNMAEIHLWDSGSGICKRKTFKPVAAPAAAESSSPSTPAAEPSAPAEPAAVSDGGEGDDGPTLGEPEPESPAKKRGR
jgi:hypothetical protein